MSDGSLCCFGSHHFYSASPCSGIMTSDLNRDSEVWKGLDVLDFSRTSWMGRAVKKPEVTVCPVKTEGRVEGDTALMCLASAMYPPLVRISWKRQKGSKEEPAPAEEKQQELSGSKSSAVIRLVKNETLYNYEYICEVQHEGGSVTNQTRFQELPEPPAPTRSGAATDRPAAPAPPPAASVRPQLPVRLPVRLPVSFQSRCRVKLLCLLYSVLIVKSLVYCSGLSVLMVLRNKGPAPS
ncbi:uncharacterized protein LOC111608887 isoform X1 [Xiphophorus maculatus]|uniref:uncharacterized protein LOC111608887 isoform X1 n=1 Tax=Xiphophorus maculatus TaxID=8083 RepID=UPI000C6E60DB|nr:uncharacterized protein LOC111608887 isoform X1 [Xiphophorus maculatus]